VIGYHNAGYKRNDLRRANAAGFPLVNPADINDLDFLPSANLILKMKETRNAQMNFRMNYSQSLARPSMRELNDGAIYDNEFRTLIYGNSDLQAAHIKNYDFRLETYFKKGDNVSVSLFYKDFTNHIEMSFGNGGLSWNNVGKSTVRGIELEGKKSLTRRFELKANLTFVKSNSQVIRQIMDLVDGKKVYTPTDTLNRPMFGQAPYIINGIFTYTEDSLGLTATISYNLQGPRLVLTGVIPGRPDVYEMQRHLVDFKVTKTLGKHFSLSLTVRDILNAPVRRTYKLNNGFDDPIDYDKFRYGTNYLLSVAYKL
jgi:outer membrane receptor protein involved in Fe transport